MEAYKREHQFKRSSNTTVKGWEELTVTVKRELELPLAQVQNISKTQRT